MASKDQEQEGWRLLSEGRLEEAESHFRHALELDPDRVDALNGLGQVYLAWDELDEAAELFQMALVMAEPDLPRNRRRVNIHDPAVQPYLRALHMLAVTRIRRMAWEDAIPPLEELLAWDPAGHEGEAHLWLGFCRHRLGDVEAARAYYEVARTRHAAAWYLHGLASVQCGRVDEAVKSFRTGAELWPEAAPLLAYYPRVRGLDRRAPSQPADRYTDAVRFVENTIDLWRAADLSVLRDALYQDAVGSL
jgi:tetratricopeptide (TPR) repeat protein